MSLLKNCAVPVHSFPIRLEAKWFRYSFEFVDDGAWNSILALQFQGRSAAAAANLTRSSPPQTAIADAAWHCSFCFKTFEDFVHKIESFSHQEYNRAVFKTRAHLHPRICDGRDLFDRWPEQYTYPSLFRALSQPANRLSSLHDAPALSYVQQHASTFAYLLPGKCRRE